MTISQRSFGGGEIAPALHARCDTAKYPVALKTMRNFTTMRHGGATSRAGTTLVAEVKDSTKRVRLVEFIFNSDQTYVLEFGDLYMRVHRNGQQLKVGSTPYEIVTPYTEADLQDLQYVQSADVVTIVHRSYPVQELKRTGDTAWTIAPMVFTISMPAPTPYSASKGAAGTFNANYKVTATNAVSFEESLPTTTGVPIQISTIGLDSTSSTTAIQTTTPHGLILGDYISVLITSGTMGSIFNGQVLYKVTVVNSTTVITIKTVADVNVIPSGTFFVGRIYTQSIRLNSSAQPTVAAPNLISFAHIDLSSSGGPKAGSYTIYKEQNGVYGYLGTLVPPTGAANGLVLTFADSGALPDIGENPPSQQTVFSAYGDYPGVVTYFQQRLMFANTLARPETIFGSQIGRFKNFTSHLPLRDDDAVTYTMAGREVNEVRHLLDLSHLIVLTSGGEQAAQGDGNGTLTPTAFNKKQYDYNGAARLRPIVIGGSALYVQALSALLEISVLNTQESTTTAETISRSIRLTLSMATRSPIGVIKSSRIRSSGRCETTALCSD